MVDMDPNGSMGTVARQRAEEDGHFRCSGLAYIHSPPNFLVPRLFFVRASWEAGSDEGVHLALALALRPDTVVVDMSGDLETSKRGLERVRFWVGMAGAQISGVQAVVLVSPQRDLMDQAIRAIEMYGSALSTRLRAFRSAFRRRSARFPSRIPFPRRGFFGMPARIPRRRSPSCSSSPAGPPAPPPTDDNHAHPQAPPPHARKAHLHSPKRALSSLFVSYAHLLLHLPPFFASTFAFPSVYPQSGRACRILCQTPFSWSS